MATTLTITTALAAVAAAAASPEITIDVAAVTNRVPTAMRGCHFSSLNHQIDELDTQLIYDESFEHVLNIWDNTSHPEYAGNGWSNYSNSASSSRGGDPPVTLRWDPDARNGNVSARFSAPGAVAVNTRCFDMPAQWAMPRFQWAAV